MPGRGDLDPWNHPVAKCPLRGSLDPVPRDTLERVLEFRKASSAIRRQRYPNRTHLLLKGEPRRPPAPLRKAPDGFQLTVNCTCLDGGPSNRGAARMPNVSPRVPEPTVVRRP